MNSFIRDYDYKEVDTLIISDSIQYNNKFRDVSGLKIFHTNIRSIDKNFDELKLFLRQFVHSFEIIILSETFQIDDLQPYKIPGYSIIYNDGKFNRNDGVVVYVKDCIKYESEVVSLGSLKVMKLFFTWAKKKFCITSIYRLHNVCPLEFNSRLRYYLKEIKGSIDYSVIVGDININILDQKFFTQEYLNIMHEHGYVSQINKFTRVDGQKKSCIDHIFIKYKDIHTPVTPVILHEQITDHYPVILHVGIASDKHINDRKVDRVKYIINYNLMKQQLEHENWSEIYNSENVNSMSEAFINKIQNLVKENTRTVRLQRESVHRKCWVTSGLIKSMRIKNQLYKESKLYPNNVDILNKYRNYKNKLAKLIKIAKMQYYNLKIYKSGNTTKNLYAFVNTICSKTNQHTIKNDSEHIGKIKLPDGSLSDDRDAIANYFNAHYATFGHGLASGIDITSATQCTSRFKASQNIYLTPTDEYEIERIINSLKSNTSPGYDGIKTEILKEIKLYIRRPLSFIVNKIIENGEWPTWFKIGIISPIYKNGDRTEVENYRPITLISNIAKVAEKVIKTRVVNYLDKYEMLSDSQFGFRLGRSAQDALERLAGYVYSALDGGRPSLCVFVDLAKAFDTVNHSILLEKLEMFGFRGRAHSLLRSYLTNRQHQVRIGGNVYSGFEPVICGVPQGTVLGPLLFLIYVDDLLTLETSGQIVSYADDTAVFYSGDSWEALKVKVEQDFLAIRTWFSLNLLTINSNKTKFINFSSYENNQPSDNLTIGNADSVMHIQAVKSIKYLGVIIDQHFRWNLHINQLTNKLRPFISKFKHLKNFLDIHQLKTLYHSFIGSQLSYGIIAWGSARKCYKKGLEVIQKWILKIIFNKRRTYPSDDLYGEAGIFDIRQLYASCILVRLHKRLNSVPYPDHHYDTRNRNLICRKQRCRKDVGQRNFSFIGWKLLDSLPLEIKTEAVYNKYKRKVNRWLLETPRDTISRLVDDE